MPRPRARPSPHPLPLPPGPLPSGPFSGSAGPRPTWAPPPSAMPPRGGQALPVLGQRPASLAPSGLWHRPGLAKPVLSLVRHLHIHRTGSFVKGGGRGEIKNSPKGKGLCNAALRRRESQLSVLLLHILHRTLMRLGGGVGGGGLPCPSEVNRRTGLSECCDSSGTKTRLPKPVFFNAWPVTPLCSNPAGGLGVRGVYTE